MNLRSEWFLLFFGLIVIILFTSQSMLSIYVSPSTIKKGDSVKVLFVPSYSKWVAGDKSLDASFDRGYYYCLKYYVGQKMNYEIVLSYPSGLSQVLERGSFVVGEGDCGKSGSVRNFDSKNIPFIASQVGAYRVDVVFRDSSGKQTYFEQKTFSVSNLLNECVNGEKRCLGKVVQQCVNTEWTHYTSCDYACVDGKCVLAIASPIASPTPIASPVVVQKPVGCEPSISCSGNSVVKVLSDCSREITLCPAGCREGLCLLPFEKSEEGLVQPSPSPTQEAISIPYPAPKCLNSLGVLCDYDNVLLAIIFVGLIVLGFAVFQFTKL